MSLNGTDYFAELKEKYKTGSAPATQPQQSGSSTGRQSTGTATAGRTDYFAELKKKYGNADGGIAVAAPQTTDSTLTDWHKGAKDITEEAKQREIGKQIADVISNFPQVKRVREQDKKAIEDIKKQATPSKFVGMNVVGTMGGNLEAENWDDKVDAVKRLIRDGKDADYAVTDALLKQLKTRQSGQDFITQDDAILQNYYDTVLFTKQADILAKTKMDGKDYSVLEELQRVARMDGEEKKKRKTAVLKKMEELGIDPKNYAIFSGDSNFTLGNFGNMLGWSALSGLSGAWEGLASTADFFVGKPLQNLGWENNPISEAHEFWEGEHAYEQAKASLYTERLGGGKGWQFTSDVVGVTFGAIPDALMAYATAGASAPNLASKASYETVGNGLARAGLKAEQMMRNPNYWTSFARTVGNDYEEAKERGASDTVATLGAILTSLVNAGIETGVDGGSGIQGLTDDLAKNKNTLWAFVESIAEESGEEGLQKFVSEIVTKVAYDQDAEILKPKEYARDMALGGFAAIGLGGLQTGSKIIADSYNQLQANKEQMLKEVIDEVLGLDVSAPADVGAVEQTQKNTTQTSGNKYHLRGYSQQQKENWRSSKRIVLYEGIEQFKNFIKNALSGKIQTNKKLYFGAIDSDLASAISRETGVNVEGYNLALGENEIRKINKDHGNEQTEAPRGQRAVTEADYLSIPDVVQSPDSIKLSSKLYEGKPVIEFRKTNGNETTVVSAVVSDKRLDLFVQTTYVNKKRGSIATPESEQADSNTPKATGGTAPIDASLDGGSHSPKAASSDVSSDASTNSIPENTPSVNTNSTQPPNPIDSMGAAPGNPAVGAAEQNFTGRAAYQDLLSDENSQRDRPGDVRPVEVPKVDGYGRNVSEFVGNAYGSKVVPDNFTATIEELVQEGALGYDTKTNAESLREAAEIIKKKGMATTRNAVTKNIANGKVGDTDIATAMLLFNQYANKKGQQAQESAAELFVDLQMMATQTGRDLQLFKMLRKMTPQGQLMAVTKNVDRYVQNINKRRGRNKQVDVSIPKELTDEYMEAAQEATVTDTPENQQRKLDAEQAIYAYAAANIPATLQEKWDAWRYLAMLGNPKTQIRNVLGNAVFRPFVETKRYLGAAMEAIFLEQDQRTKAVLGFGEDARALLSWARQDSRTADIMKRMEYTATTGDAAASEIDDQRRIFDAEILERARTGLNDLMSAEDMFFKRGVYSTALASFLKARGITAQQLQSGAVNKATLNAARDYAVKEAMKATFNDQNAVSNFVASKLRYKGNNTFGKLLNAAAEGILPFRRTPANIALRGLEYSPLGLGKTLLADTGKLRNGEISAAEYIDNIAAGLTGSVAMGIGFALAAGIFEGIRLVGIEDDEDEKRTGHKSYALEIGNVSIPIDWAAPSALPLFMGANLYNSFNPDSENVSTSAFTAFLDATANTLDPMLELSCLSSLNDLLTDARYAEEGREIYSIAASAATSYFMQGLPTLFGQVEQAFETEKKSVYADSSDPVISEVQQVLGRATQKIPGIDLYQTEKVDAWGRTEEKGVVERIFDAFINPANDSKIVETAADTEIKRLNRVQDENVSPDTPAKKLTFTGKDGETYTDRRLTGAEYEELAKLQGQTQKQLVEDLIASSDYASLSDEDKAKAIRYAYDYARDSARGEVVKDHPGITTKWMKELGDDVADGIIRHITADGKYTFLSVSNASYIDDLLDGLVAEKGKTNVRDIQRIEAIADSKLSEKDQKAVLKDTLDASAYEKYLRILATGVDTDDYALSYRLYLDAKGGTGKKERIISSFQDELDVSRSVAEKLYDIYSGKK